MKQALEAGLFFYSYIKSLSFRKGVKRPKDAALQEISFKKACQDFGENLYKTHIKNAVLIKVLTVDIAQHTQKLWVMQLEGICLYVWALLN